jgi:hydroxyacylglutathione hydrolase
MHCKIGIQRPILKKQWRKKGPNTMLETSKLEIVTIPALEDNYYFLIHDPKTGRTAVVDAGTAEPILAELKARDWTLDEIWLTHHHSDHIDGAPELMAKTGATLTGAHADAHRLPPLTHTLSAGDSFTFAEHRVDILPADGHTRGHIAFYIPSANALFSADSLISLGCGRLFEGTPRQMFDTLAGFKALPLSTLVYSGHEYAGANGAFALTVEPQNAALQARVKDIAAARAQNQPTVPSTLALECETNPFLRTDSDAIKHAVGATNGRELDVFTQLRTRKDHF